jgi:hypothetical protein
MASIASPTDSAWQYKVGAKIIINIISKHFICVLLFPSEIRIHKNSVQTGLLASGSSYFLRLPGKPFKRLSSGIVQRSSPVTVAGQLPFLRDSLTFELSRIYK